ncbi:hypothetical protein CCOS865_03609 [Pseudomonas reidholzensis]|uniref:Lipoprotein n=1 Tax=Pseudomonas reidholzensis TaxID=1785162 RepID=A0A383RW82_9PSED|nr:hypothetical protein [Pseudomonas reidholzensis]SYX91340.1 hypothetical protein CCOS865_03609 [Pseudomonas reidholzensis]
MKAPPCSLKEVPVLTKHPLRPLPIALLCLLTLAGCKTSEPAATDTAEAIDPKVMQQFVGDMQKTLQTNIANAVRGTLVGAVKLSIKLDQTYAPVACKAQEPGPKLASLLPADANRSDFKSLAAAVEAQCWKTVYPPVPAGAYDEDGTVEIVAPLILMPSANQQPPNPAWVARQQQREFFWQQLLREQPVDSIGVAIIRYQANSQGKVQGCLIELRPSAARADAFRMDGGLQSRLSSACMALDLQRMPGFAPDPQGKMEGFALVEYAPWKVGRP